MEHVNFSDSYYDASQKLIVASDDKEFDSCTNAASVEAILKTKDGTMKVGAIRSPQTAISRVLRKPSSTLT